MLHIPIASTHFCHNWEKKPMNYKIETFEGIGTVVGDKLRANGNA
jgi:hypothetical protein